MGRPKIRLPPRNIFIKHFLSLQMRFDLFGHSGAKLQTGTAGKMVAFFSFDDLSLLIFSAARRMIMKVGY